MDARCLRCGFNLNWMVLTVCKSALTALWILFLILCHASPGFSHGEGLDTHGCHHDGKLGGYHCHRGMFAGQQFNSKSEMLRRLRSGTPTHERQSQSRIVTRVVDGDTIIVGAGERVRLIGVDTPETMAVQKPVGHFGREPTAFTKGMVQGKRVRLEFDQANAHIGHKDRLSRTLAYVFLEDGTFLNAEIIKQGYGFAYTRFPFKYLDEFRHFEREAREQRRGLWGKSR